MSTQEPAPCNVLVPHGWLLSAADMVIAAVCTPHHASAEEPQSSLCGSYNTKKLGACPRSIAAYIDKPKSLPVPDTEETGMCVLAVL